MYNFDYQLPVLDYMSEEKGLIPYSTTFYELGSFSTEDIMNTLDVMLQVVKEVSEIVYNALYTTEEKYSLLRKVFVIHLGLHLQHFHPTEMDLISIEKFLMKRIDELKIVKESRAFEEMMEAILHS